MNNSAPMRSFPPLQANTSSPRLQPCLPNYRHNHRTNPKNGRLMIICKDVGDESKSKKRKKQSKIVSKTETVGASSEESVQVSVMKKLDDVNPVGLGRRSRLIFDEVWRKFSGLGQMTSSSSPNNVDEEMMMIREGGPMCDFAIPGAQNTTVLVVGATSRVGRIVVRKLMLRGYTVKVLPLLLTNNTLCDMRLISTVLVMHSLLIN